jgi:thiol:disulfide interchange protein
MKSWMNIVFQLCSFVISATTLITNAVPEKYKSVVVLVVSLAQAFIAWYAHQVNPDGSPATTAYVKPTPFVPTDTPPKP